MKRLVAVIGFMILAGAVEGVPDRRPLEPEFPAPPAVLDLRGTTWRGKDFVENYQMTFEADGTMTYGYKNQSHRGGTWVQNGGQIYWEVNMKYRETKAIVTGEMMEGESWNKAGKRWQTILKRVK